MILLYVLLCMHQKRQRARRVRSLGTHQRALDRPKVNMGKRSNRECLVQRLQTIVDARRCFSNQATCALSVPSVPGSIEAHELPHQGPAAHQVQPIHTGCWSMCVSIASIPSSHTELAPPANSLRKPRNLCCSSQRVAPAKPSTPAVLEAHTGFEPLESLSKYWCMSNAKLLPGSVKFSKA